MNTFIIKRHIVYNTNSYEIKLIIKIYRNIKQNTFEDYKIVLKDIEVKNTQKFETPISLKVNRNIEGKNLSHAIVKSKVICKKLSVGHTDSLNVGDDLRKSVSG